MSRPHQPLHHSRSAYCLQLGSVPLPLPSLPLLTALIFAHLDLIMWCLLPPLGPDANLKKSYMRHSRKWRLPIFPLVFLHLYMTTVLVLVLQVLASSVPHLPAPVTSHSTSKLSSGTVTQGRSIWLHILAPKVGLVIPPPLCCPGYPSGELMTSQWLFYSAVRPIGLWPAMGQALYYCWGIFFAQGKPVSLYLLHPYFFPNWWNLWQ